MSPIPPITPIWQDATQDVPDADILVLACNAKHETYWIASFDGATWRDADSETERRVTHWQDLPEVPR